MLLRIHAARACVLLFVTCAACSHQDELDDIEFGVRSELEALPPRCLIQTPADSTIAGAAQDGDPAQPGYQGTLEIETDARGEQQDIQIEISGPTSSKDARRSKANGKDSFLASYPLSLAEGAYTVKATCEGEDGKKATDQIELEVDLTPCALTITSPQAAAVFVDSEDADTKRDGIQALVSGDVSGDDDCITLRWGICAADGRLSGYEEISREPANGSYGVQITLPFPGEVSACVEVQDKAGNRAMQRVNFEHLQCFGAEVLCGKECRTDTQNNPDFCGETCQVCTGVDNGSAVCEGGVCGVECDENHHFENGQCIPRLGCDGLRRACAGGDCCERVDVAPEAGQMLRFQRGWDASEDSTPFADNNPSEWQSRDPNAIVTLSPFWMDRYEVTVSRFRQFLEVYEDWRSAGAQPRSGYAYHPQVGVSSGWRSAWTTATYLDSSLGDATKDLVPTSKQDFIERLRSCGGHTWTDSPGPNEDRPINCLNFYEAFLFCMWDGGRLPTEAEWSFAAAGGGEQRAYPWSAPPDGLTIDSNYAVYSQPDSTKPSSVGSKLMGESRLWDNGVGFMDLSGNVYEWVRDVGVAPAGLATYVADSDNPLDLTSADDTSVSTRHFMRGGSLRMPSERLRVAARELRQGVMRIGDLGVRCAGPASPN